MTALTIIIRFIECVAVGVITGTAVYYIQKCKDLEKRCEDQLSTIEIQNHIIAEKEDKK